MEKIGGSFVKSLAACWYRADPANRARLESAFAEYFDGYKEKAAEDGREAGENGMSASEKSEAYLRRLAAAREYKERNKDRLRAMNNERNKRVRADPGLWAAKLAANRAYRARAADRLKEYDRNRDRAKVNARTRIRNRIYRGTMQRMPCEICGTPKTHAHHIDYNDPLRVRWLCPAHHSQEHGNG